MKSANRLLPAVIFVMLLGCSSQPQKKPGKYTDYDYGYYFYCCQKQDSAFLMFNRYISNPDDTLKKGKAYRYMGVIQSEIGDLYGAQESLTGAVHTLDSLNKDHRQDLGLAYNTLGNVSFALKQYNDAIDLYNKAKPFLQGADYLAEVMNGKATAFQKKERYDSAIAIYDSILALKPADQLLVARITDNRAKTKWLQNSAYPALAEFQSALKIRLDSQSNGGLNASYAHLSDYYVKLNPDSALWYAQKMREKATENQSPDDVLEAINKQLRLSNSPSLKERLFEEYTILDDSLHFSRDITRSRFAMIKYDFQKSKTDNLVLKQHITRQQLSIFGLIAAAVIIITWLSVLYNKRRKRIREESENAIRNSKLKTSQKVHDVVANGLYVIMNELEHVEEIEREPLMTKIEGLYEKSRDISYEDVPLDNNADHNNRVHDLLTSFANVQTKVIIVGNEPKFWNRVSEFQKHELLLVLNELMVNMKKHSHAKNVAVQFKQEHNTGFIHYTDNGVGFNDAVKFGNGLTGTVTRIKSLNGEVNFGKSGNGGASVAISFPL